MVDIYSRTLGGPVQLASAGAGDGIIFTVPLGRTYVVKSLFLEAIYASGPADVRVAVQIGTATPIHFLSATLQPGGSALYNFHLAFAATTKLVAYLAVARAAAITVSGFDFSQ